MPVVSKRRKDGVVQRYHVGRRPDTERVKATAAATAGDADGPNPWDPDVVAETVAVFEAARPPYRMRFRPRSETVGEDKAISTDVFEVRDDPDGSVVAYLKVSYLNSHVAARQFPTGWHMSSAWEGRPSQIVMFDEGANGVDTPVPLTAGLRRKIEADHNSRRTRLDPPEYCKERLQGRLAYHLVPYVAYVQVDAPAYDLDGNRVHDGHRGRDLSLGMYEAAATLYGGLRASGVQSDDAKRMWDRWRGHPWYAEWDDPNYDDPLTGRPQRCRGLVTDMDRMLTVHLHDPPDVPADAAPVQRYEMPGVRAGRSWR